MMIKYLKLIPLMLAIALISCNGGAGGGGGNPPPGPLPTPGNVTYALIANTGGTAGKKIYSVPIDVNGNLRWEMAKPTTGGIIWDKPYYILVSNDNTRAYISEAEFSSGKVFECGIESTGMLSNCQERTPRIYRPISMSLLGNYLYISSVRFHRVVYSC